MNILLLSNVDASGEWLSVQTVAEELKKLNKNLHIHLIAYGKSRLLLKRELFDKIDILPYAPLKKPFRYYRQILLEFQQGLNAIKINKMLYRYDAVLATEYTLMLPAILSNPGAKKVFFFQGYRHHYEIGIRNFNLYMFLRKFLERFTWLISDVITVPSEYTKSMLKNDLAVFKNFRKIIVVRNVVRQEFRQKYTDNTLKIFKNKYGIPENTKIILYSGVIDRRKSIKQLVQAFYRLSRLNDNLILIIAQLTTLIDKPYWFQLKKFIAKSRLDKKILFLKNLDTPDLAKLYQVSNVAILPSKLDPGSLFFFESLVSRLPIFCTAVGDAENYFNKIQTDLLLPDYNVKSIYMALQTYFSRGDAWQKKIENKLKLLTSEFNDLHSVAEIKNLLD